MRTLFCLEREILSASLACFLLMSLALGCGGSGGNGPASDLVAEDLADQGDQLGDVSPQDTRGKDDQVNPGDTAGELPDTVVPDGGKDTEDDGEIPTDGVVDSDGIPDVPDEQEEDVPVPKNGPECVAAHGAGWAWDPEAGESGACLDCSTWVTCSGDGAKGIYHTTAKGGKCVCETLPGYYFNTEDGEVKACDADGDRWMAYSAFQATESDDTVVTFNAKCEPVLVWRVGYHPEAGTAMAADLPMSALVEPDARDDQEMLDSDSTAPVLDGGRAPLASELNPLTRFCATADADYNGNGVADLAEEQLAADELDPTVAPFAGLTFFAETHRWWLDEEQGTLHIAERPRDATQADAVPLTAGDGVGEYWQQCALRIESNYVPESKLAGYDFADVPGMLHHSLFRCVQVVDTQEESPVWAVALADASAYHLNQCTLLEASPEGGVPFSCLPVATPEPGSVYMSIAAYQPYGEASNYRRGCVDLCGEGWQELDNCPGYAAAHAVCQQDALNFGFASCACGSHFMGEQCELCSNHWSGAECDTCPAPWIGDQCSQCPGYWSGENCATCAPPFSGYYCDSCLSANFDPATTCAECYRDPVKGYYDGESCDACYSHYFDSKNYVSANLMVNTGGADGVGNWTTEGGSAMGVWNGETVILHPDYPAVATQVVDLMANQEVAIMLAQASKYGLELVLDGGVQLAEFTQIEVWLKDGAGNNIAASSYYCTSIGYVTIEFPQYMSVCQNLTKATFSGPTLDIARQAVVKVTSYGDLSMYSWKGLHNKVTGASLRLKANYWTPRCMACTEGWVDSTPEADDCAVCPIRFAESDPLDPGFQPATCHVCRDDDYGHFAGPTCQECKSGWSGEQCNVPVT